MFRACYLAKRSFGIINKDAQSRRVFIETKNYRIDHPMWKGKDPSQIEIKHYKPKGVADWIAYGMLNSIIRVFDVLSGFRPGKMNERGWNRHFLFMESISGVPRVTAAFIRHWKSIFYSKHDSGAYHHLIEEEENERMHLFFWTQLGHAGSLVKSAIILYQFFFVFFYGTMYALSPKVGHRFLGYLEENIIRSYTLLLDDIDAGRLPLWKDMQPPKVMLEYYELPETSRIRDLVIEIRADEALHREVHHHLAETPMKEQVEDDPK